MYSKSTLLMTQFLRPNMLTMLLKLSMNILIKIVILEEEINENLYREMMNEFHLYPIASLWKIFFHIIICISLTNVQNFKEQKFRTQLIRVILQKKTN